MSVVEIETARESLRERVVTAGTRWSAGQRELVRSIAALDASGEWAVDGAATCAHWVANALDVEVCTARDWVRVGRCLAVLPSIDAAFEQGRLSYSKVRALICVATPENEGELWELAKEVAAGRLARALAAWLARHETPAETEQRQRDARCLSWRVRPDGVIAGWFRFAPS